jgi:hypothetical protein
LLLRVQMRSGSESGMQLQRPNQLPSSFNNLWPPLGQTKTVPCNGREPEPTAQRTRKYRPCLLFYLVFRCFVVYSCVAYRYVCCGCVMLFESDRIRISCGLRFVEMLRLLLQGVICCNVFDGRNFCHSWLTAETVLTMMAQLTEAGTQQFRWPRRAFHDLRYHHKTSTTCLQLPGADNLTQVRPESRHFRSQIIRPSPAHNHGSDLSRQSTSAYVPGDDAQWFK